MAKSTKISSSRITSKPKSRRKGKSSNFFGLKFKLVATLLFTLFVFISFFSEDIALSYKSRGLTGLYERLKHFDVSQIEDYEEFEPDELENNYVLFNIFESHGVASYFADKFVGRKTSSGERFSQNDFSCAHKKLKFGSIVKVTNLENHKVTLVKVNDRGPFARNRIIDLSKRASNSINASGTSSVKIEGIKRFNKYILQKNDEFYNGYSIYSDFVCLPNSEIKMIDSTLNFTEVMDVYLSINETKSIPNLYIFQKAMKSEDLVLVDDYFYLGYVTKPKTKK